jgi:hypothetical protein
MIGDFAVVVPWVNEAQLAEFLKRWCVEDERADWLVLQHDARREGSGKTKNNGVETAMFRGADMVVVLDDDCYPHGDIRTLPDFAAAHRAVLQSNQTATMFETVTDPPSRGTPYFETGLELPVAASMGFWVNVGDYCAVRQLAHGCAPMRFFQQAVFGRYFPLCGMNLAFRPRKWLPWCRFIEVPRFDDIWMGWLWQKEAYKRRCCFSLAGPLVEHARQSNVWKNLEQEAKYLSTNETLWKHIAMSEAQDYPSLRALLPC